MGILRRMRLVPVPVLTACLAVAAAVLVGAVDLVAQRRQMMAERQVRLQEEVALAVGLLAGEQARVARGEITLAAAQQHALELVAAMGERLGRPLWVTDAAGRPLGSSRPPAAGWETSGTLLAHGQAFADWGWKIGAALPRDDIGADQARALWHGGAVLLMLTALLAAAALGWRRGTAPLRPARPAGLAALDGKAAFLPTASAVLAAEAWRERLLLESAGEGILAVDRDGRCVICTAAAAQLLGYERAEDLLGHDIHAMIHHSYPDGTPYPAEDCRARAVFEGLSTVVDDEVYWRRDGTPLPVEYRMHPMIEDGETVGAVVTFFDISERKRAEESLRLGHTVFNAATEAIIVCDARIRIKAVNPAFTRTTGYAAEEVLGRLPSFLDSGRHPASFFNAIRRRLRKDGRWQGEVWHRRKNGEIRADWVSLAAIGDAQGRIVEYVGLLTDITARKHDEERIRWHATFDALTELPNRQTFLGVLAHALQGEAGEEARAEGAALLFLDLDRFKAVNDTHGHAVGDKLLQTVAKRLRHAVRDSDTLGRLGGDEFTVLIERLERPELAAQICRKIIESLSHPFCIDGLILRIGVSIGVALFPGDAEDPDELIKRADQAMYRAKAAGRNVFCFYGAPAVDELLSS